MQNSTNEIIQHDFSDITCDFCGILDMDMHIHDNKKACENCHHSWWAISELDTLKARVNELQHFIAHFPVAYINPDHSEWMYKIKMILEKKWE